MDVMGQFAIAMSAFSGGMLLGRYCSPSLADLGLTESQRKQIESAIENQSIALFTPLFLLFAFGMPVLLVLLLLTSISILVQYFAVLIFIAGIVYFGIMGSRKQKKIMHDAILKVRGNGAVTGG
jgi:hypothetical protein